MFKSISRSLALLVASLSLIVLPALAPAYVFAQADIQDNECGAASTLSVDSSSGCSATNNANSSFDNLITAVINIFSVVVGVVAVIMIIYGGFRYITSGGDSGNVGNAKNTIIYAVVGLIIVALAQIIVKFVLNKVTTTGS